MYKEKRPGKHNIGAFLDRLRFLGRFFAFPGEERKQTPKYSTYHQT
jgi:hypothetical protein